MGGQDGSDGKTRELTPTGCPVTFTHMPQYTPPPTRMLMKVQNLKWYVLEL